jgi:hypothetical protein
MSATVSPPPPAPPPPVVLALPPPVQTSPMAQQPYWLFNPSTQYSVDAHPPDPSGQQVQLKSIHPLPQSFWFWDAHVPVPPPPPVQTLPLGQQPYWLFDPMAQYSVDAQPPEPSGQQVQLKSIQSLPQSFWPWAAHELTPPLPEQTLPMSQQPYWLFDPSTQYSVDAQPPEPSGQQVQPKSIHPLPQTSPPDSHVSRSISRLKSIGDKLAAMATDVVRLRLRLRLRKSNLYIVD